MDLETLAKEVRERAWVPYSRFKVGAAIRAGSGQIYGGCNVENASYGLSCCAERVAVYKAVADSKREFDAVAVVADTEEPFVPCGSCCQVMAEFDIPEIIMANLKGDIRVLTLKELAPYAVTMGTNRRRCEQEEEEEK